MNRKHKLIISASSGALGALLTICGIGIFTHSTLLITILFAYGILSNFVGDKIYKHYNSLLPAAPDQFLLEGEREVELFLGNVSQDEINNEQGLKRLTPPRFIRG